MTDRELLEKAAKAAGIDGPLWEMYPGQWCIDIRASEPNGAPAIWNPLADDGDALRLAVKLRLTVRAGYVHTPEHGNFDEGLLRVKQNADDATRRAIVRAAAAIGDAS